MKTLVVASSDVAQSLARLTFERPAVPERAGTL